VSNSTVNGPSFSRSTSISAPNTPRPTRTPARSSCAARCSTSSAARPEERRPPALARVGEQRELGHDERLTADACEVLVRLPVRVAEDPKTHDLGRELLGICLGVLVSDADQQEVAEADRSHLFAVHRDRRAADPLQHHPH
jgi:hypothetical protein